MLEALQIHGGGGCVLGAIIGDIVGSRFERMNYKGKDFELFTLDCRLTDDSIMTLAVAKGIMDAKASLTLPKDFTSSRFQEALLTKTTLAMQTLGRKYPYAGYGGRFSSWLFSDNPRPYHSLGNGAAMRISPVAHVAQNEENLKALAQIVTAITHNHPEGLKGAEAVAMAIYMARNDRSKADIEVRIAKDYYPLDFDLDTIRPHYRFDVTCQGSVPQALKAFLESTDFEDAIRNAVSISGDSDTIAAITGSIAEAFYGIPQCLKDAVLGYMDVYQRGIFDEWERYLKHLNL